MIQLSLSPEGRFRLWHNEDVFVEVPVTAIGLVIIRDTLIARMMGEKKIGTTGAPTQAQIDAIVKAWKKENPVVEDKPNINLEGVDI